MNTPKYLWRMIGIMSIIALLIVMAMASCHTKYILKHKDEICAMCPEKVVTNTVDSVVYKLDTVYQLVYIDVELPKDTVTVTKYINGKVQDIDTIRVTNGLAYALAWIKDNSLGVSVYIEPTLQVKIDSLETIVASKERFRVETKEKVIKITERYIPSYIWWLIAVVFLLGVFGKRIIKMFV